MSRVFVVQEARSNPCVALYEDGVPVTDEFFDPDRDEPYALLIRLDLFGYADDHDS